MFIKKFTAPSLEEALAQIKKELGPDTFILQTDQKPSSFFKKKQIEVTVASQKDPKQALNSEKLSEVFPHRKKEILDRQNSQRPEKETKNPPQKSQTSPPVASNSVPPDPAENKLRLMGFSEETIKKCAQHLIFEFSREDRANKRIFEKTVSELLAKGIKTLSRSVFESRRCWVAVGLPGSGKTTVLAKLALVLKPHYSGIHLLSHDNRKITGRHELAAYASLIDIPFSTPESNLYTNSNLQLIDTPSLSHASNNVASIEKITRSSNTLVVIDASQRFTEMKRTLQLVESLAPFALTFTRLDEVSELGPLYEILRLSKLPLLGVSHSQSFSVPFKFLETQALCQLVLKSGAAGLNTSL